MKSQFGDRISYIGGDQSNGYPQSTPEIRNTNAEMRRALHPHMRVWYHVPKPMKRTLRKFRFNFSSKPKKRKSIRHHHQVVGGFIVIASLLVLSNIALILMPAVRVAASSADNVRGWVWSAQGGWLSMNSINPEAPSSYSWGVNINPATRAMTGFAWSASHGWMCFGSSCASFCPGLAPDGQPAIASSDGSGNLEGWAKFCSLGSDGWVSLNCSNMAECATSNYKVSVNFSTGVFTGWAWHASTGNSGWGWMDFSRVTMNAATESAADNPLLCRNGLDDDLDGAIDCADTGCMYQEPTCPATEVNCALIGNTNCCANSIDDDGDGSIDCLDTDVGDCSSIPACQPEVCTDGIDNNGNGQIDCDDAQCIGAPGCEICDNAPIDDDGDGDVDCDDSDCFTSPLCTPAWLESKFGNVYAAQGIEGNPPPALRSNATYCLSTAGTITGFSSEHGCEETGEASVDLPIGPDGYASALGRIDVNGILSGRYGQVKTITSAAQIDSPMSGKVFLYEPTSCSSPFILPAMTFNNAAGGETRGSGLLVIKGCDLRITGNLNYQAAGATGYLRNLASLGILVLSKYQGSTRLYGGRVVVDPGVTQVVGSIFAEHSISTGSTGDRRTDEQLHMYGSLVSRQILFERQWSSPDEPAEKVEFDGRAIVNPPPGFQDAAKSLPSLSDRY